MPRPTVNLAAGRRYLGARRHARLLDRQVDAIASVQDADLLLVDLMRVVKAIHTKNRAAQSHMIEANRAASEAVYEPPVASMAAVA